MAVAGAALAVAPMRYLVRPGTAWAVIAAGGLRSGLCLDGYTAFCCEIEHGDNTCPRGTYMAGWWKCTSYQGSGLCSAEGVRYYIDCNRMPGRAFPGGCQCAQRRLRPAARGLQPLPLRPVQYPGRRGRPKSCAG